MNRFFDIRFAVCIGFICLASLTTLAKSQEISTDFSIFINARKTGDAAAVNQFVIDGASVNGQEYGDWSPLMWAIFHGHREIVQRHQDSGADTNYTDHIRQTPFIFAVRVPPAESPHFPCANTIKPKPNRSLITLPLGVAVNRGRRPSMIIYQAVGELLSFTLKQSIIIADVYIGST